MCTSPLTLFIDSSGHKYAHKPRDRVTTKTRVPCRKCRACLIRQQTDKKVRGCHEASLHESNQFLTMTYDQLPTGQSLNHVDVQKFHRRLRKAGYKVTFMLAGEYGSQTYRPHYHGIYFGMEIQDLIPIRTVNGNVLYRSPDIERHWRRGHVIIGDVTPASIVYVAGYIKKLVAEWETIRDHGSFVVPDIYTGELLNVEPPYYRCSTNPGIGRRWFEQYWRDVFKADECILNGKRVPVPEYYFKLYEKANPEAAAEIKERRLASMLDASWIANNTPERLQTRAAYLEAIFGSIESRETRRFESIGTGQYDAEGNRVKRHKPYTDHQKIGSLLTSEASPGALAASAPKGSEAEQHGELNDENEAPE